MSLSAPIDTDYGHLPQRGDPATLREARRHREVRDLRARVRSGLAALRTLACRGHAQPGERQGLERALAQDLRAYFRLRWPERYVTRADVERLAEAVERIVSEASHPELDAFRAARDRPRSRRQVLAVLDEVFPGREEGIA